MADEPRTPETVEVTRKVRAFDLDKFEKVSVEVTTKFTDSGGDLQTAMNRIGNDQEKIADAIDGLLLKQAVKEAKAEAMATAGESVVSSVKTINDFVNNFRLMPAFANIKERKEQTAAIHAFIKANEPLKNSLVTLAKAMQDVAGSGGADEDEDDE